MATTVTGGNVSNWEAYFKYTVTPGNSSYKITMNDSGIHNINSYGFSISSGIKTTSYIGSTTKSASGGFSVSSGSEKYADIVGTWSKTIKKAHSAQTVTLKAVTKNSSGFQNGTSTASKTVTIPALASYTVAFNANGGSGAPSSQKKWYGETLTLSSTNPTRTGYDFKGWATSSTATTSTYSAGGSYTANSAATLYAVWELAYSAPSISSVSVDRCVNTLGTDGGAGKYLKVTVSKTIDSSLSLSSAKVEYSEYGSGSYKASSFTTSGPYIVGGDIEALTKYSVRVTITDSAGQTATKTVTVSEAEYSLPTCTNVSAVRTNDVGEYSEEGTNGKITFNYTFDSMSGSNSIASITVGYREQGTTDYTQLDVALADGTATALISGGVLDIAKNYDVRIDVEDQVTSIAKYALITNTKFVMDFLRGGLGVAIGKAAYLEGYFDVDLKAIFRDSLTFPNAKGIFGTGTDGVARHNFQPCSSNDNVVVGYGNYADGIGATNIYGEELSFTSNNKPTVTAPDVVRFIHSASGNSIGVGVGSEGVNRGIYDYVFDKWVLYCNETDLYIASSRGGAFKPYYTAGDTISLDRLNTAGFVTSSKTKVYFSFNPGKPLYGVSSISCSSIDGLTLRQDGAYTHGSSSSSLVKPSSYLASAVGNSIGICATFTKTTNAVNNAPIGVAASIKITFA